MSTLRTQMITDGAVGLWRMADAPGASVGVDDCVHSSAQLSPGTTLGVGGIPGGQGDTACFASSYATVPDVASQRVGNTLSLEFWMRRGNVSVRQDLFGGGGAGTPGIRFHESNVLEFMNQNVSDVVVSTAAVTDTINWHHIVATRSGGSFAKIYIDAVDVSGGFNNDGFGSTSGVGWRLFGGNTTGSATGNFAYVALYALPLSLGQVQNHYTLGITGTPPSNTSPPVVQAASGTFAGSTITSTTGVWMDLYGGGVISYQWQRDRLGDNNFQNVSGTNGPAYNKYVLKRADYGCNFRCTTTMTNSGGTASATSNSIGPVYIRGTMGIPIGVPR